MGNFTAEIAHGTIQGNSTSPQAAVLMANLFILHDRSALHPPLVTPVCCI